METRIDTSHGAFFIDETYDKKMADVLRHATYPNEALLAIAQEFINDQSVVVDIGAHIGTFAVPMAKRVKEVIAFEPSPSNFALLACNAAENGVKMQLINKALGSTKGSGALEARNVSNAGTNTLVEGGDIVISTLDDEVTRVDFIKLDVEGMELEVLRGGTQLIERARPVILFEVHLSQLRAHDVLPRALEKFFTARGYALYVPREHKPSVFAHVRSITLLTALIAPRAWLFGSESAPFDLIAIPRERTLPHRARGFFFALFGALKNNLTVKMRRLRALLQ